VPTIHIDGRAFEVRADRNLLHACLELGLDLPYFCWHPALGSVGACRQCAVKQFRDADDADGRLVMACMTAAEDGVRIAIDDDEAVAFRAQVIEWLMLNHPHDCPICDEGGECHLQDMTVMTGHALRRARSPKRTHRNQDLGPLVTHEMNRCIQCYRCVRFYRDYAGGTDLDVFGAHDHVYFGRQQDGTLESPFAGNLVEVCPTGVFTDKRLAGHYARKWDLQSSPAVCAHCAVGCNVTVGERDGTVRRVRNRYHGQVNGYFLCDRGRFGYEFVNDAERLRAPEVRRDGASAPATAEDACRTAGALLVACDRIIGIGSPRASLESNYALRALVGRDNFFSGLGRGEAALADAAVSIAREGPVPIASLRTIETSDAVLVLGEDVGNTAPRLALALRQAVRTEPMRGLDAVDVPVWQDDAVRDATAGKTGPLYVATPDRTAVDDIATASVRAAPDDIARFGFAVAHAIDPSAPAVPDLTETLARHVSDAGAALADAERPIVVTGPSCGSMAVLRAAANVAAALRRRGRPAQWHVTAREVNTVGVTLLGGGTLEEAGAVVAGPERVGVIVLEQDLTQARPPRAADAVLREADVLVVLDHLRTPTVCRAAVALPAATFAERTGTVVSSEGRAQRSFATLAPSPGGPRPGWQWLRELAEALGRRAEVPWNQLDALIADLSATEPALAGVARAAPRADLRLAGGKVPREAARFSGRTAMSADEQVNVPRPPDDPSSPLAFSMEGARQQPPPSLITAYWAPGWNSDQALNKFQEEIGGPLHGGDPGARMIEANGDASFTFFTDPPRPFVPEDGRWLVLPAYHVFGSDELSSSAPGVAALAPAPYLALCPADAARLSLEAGSEAELSLDDRVVRLPVHVHRELPEGIALVPAGVRGMPALDLPATGAIRNGG